jgi:hypothetical protein
MGLFATTTSLSTKMIGTVFDTATTNLASASIYDAENEIKKHLCKRYDFTASPFLTTTSIPPIITTLTETLAVGYMYENMSRGSDEDYKRADRYIKRVMTNIQSLLDGEAQLTDSSGNLITEIDGDWAIKSNTDDYSNTFNEDDPNDWAVDEDKLDDISTGRE